MERYIVYFRKYKGVYYTPIYASSPDKAREVFISRHKYEVLRVELDQGSIRNELLSNTLNKA